MGFRALTTATLSLAAVLTLAGCAVDSQPRGRNFVPGKDAGKDAGDVTPDAGRDAGKDAGKDAGHEPMRDSSMPMDDAGQTPMDSGMDSGIDSGADAGPLGPPAFVVPPLAGGGLAVSPSYRLRHVIGAFGPTHKDTSRSESTSTHYRLGNAQIGPTQ